MQTNINTSVSLTHLYLISFMVKLVHKGACFKIFHWRWVFQLFGCMYRSSSWP